MDLNVMHNLGKSHHMKLVDASVFHGTPECSGCTWLPHYSTVTAPALIKESSLLPQHNQI